MNNHGGFRPGSGRPKGVVAKSRIVVHRPALEEIFDGLSYDPVLALIKEANDPTTPQALRVSIHQGLLEYVRPRKKAIDTIKLADSSLNIVINYACDSDDPPSPPPIANGGSEFTAIDIRPGDVAPYDRGD